VTRFFRHNVQIATACGRNQEMLSLAERLRGVDRLLFRWPRKRWDDVRTKILTDAFYAFDLSRVNDLAGCYWNILIFLTFRYRHVSCLFFSFVSQGSQLVGLMPVLAAYHLIYVFSVVLHCISIHVVANEVISLSV